MFMENICEGMLNDYGPMLVFDNWVKRMPSAIWFTPVAKDRVSEVIS